MPHNGLSFGLPAKAVMSMCVQNFVEALSCSRLNLFSLYDVQGLKYINKLERLNVVHISYEPLFL